MESTYTLASVCDLWASPLSYEHRYLSFGDWFFIAHWTWQNNKGNGVALGEHWEKKSPICKEGTTANWEPQKENFSVCLSLPCWLAVVRYLYNCCQPWIRNITDSSSFFPRNQAPNEENNRTGPTSLSVGHVQPYILAFWKSTVMWSGELTRAQCDLFMTWVLRANKFDSSHFKIWFKEICVHRFNGSIKLSAAASFFLHIEGLVDYVMFWLHIFKNLKGFFLYLRYFQMKESEEWPMMPLQRQCSHVASDLYGCGSQKSWDRWLASLVFLGRTPQHWTLF